MGSAWRRYMFFPFMRKQRGPEGLGEGVRQTTESEERIPHLGEDVEGQHRMGRGRVGLAQLV
jgi:hypothetical protein